MSENPEYEVIEWHDQEQSQPKLVQLNDGTEVEYAPIGWLTSVKTNDGYTITYDVHGEISRIVDPDGNQMIYSSKNKKLAQIISADGTQFDYNSDNGVLTHVKDRDGNEVWIDNPSVHIRDRNGNEIWVKNYVEITHFLDKDGNEIKFDEFGFTYCKDVLGNEIVRNSNETRFTDENGNNITVNDNSGIYCFRDSNGHWLRVNEDTGVVLSINGEEQELRKKVEKIKHDFKNYYSSSHFEALSKSYDGLRKSLPTIKTEFYQSSKNLLSLNDAYCARFNPANWSWEHVNGSDEALRQTMIQNSQAAIQKMSESEVSVSPPMEIKERYPHLTYNLVVAVKENPQAMLQYFQKHAKDCRQFPQNMEADPEKMLAWLEEYYPKFSVDRMIKIDRVCEKYAPDGYVSSEVDRCFHEAPGVMVEVMNRAGAHLSSESTVDDVRKAYLQMDGAHRKTVLNGIKEELTLWTEDLDTCELYALKYRPIEYGLPMGDHECKEFVQALERMVASTHTDWEKGEYASARRAWEWRKLGVELRKSTVEKQMFIAEAGYSR